MSDAASGPSAGPFERLNGRASLWLARCAAFVMAVLAVLTFCDVVGRYVFNYPFSFTVELTELAMGLIVYFSVGLVTHERGHVAVDVVTLRLSAGVRAVTDLIVQIVALAFLVIVVWRLFLRAQALFETGDYTPILFIPLWPVAAAMAVGAVLFLTGTFVQVMGALAKLRDRRPAS